MIVKFLFTLLFPILLFSQDFSKIGKSEVFKLSGGVSISNMYYEGANSNRQPFTYVLSGNVNLNISDVYNVPVSFSYSNAHFQTNNPFSFNRLSIHPSYKWLTTHIGDVSMTFSPYSLNGHQFTGLGVDATPGDKIKVSLMYGRLLKEREYDENNINGVASYKRMGYGVKTSYKFEKINLGCTFFKAKDIKESLQGQIPIEKDIQPKENLVIGLDGNFNIVRGLTINAEITKSILTGDTRIKSGSVFLIKTNMSTQYYKAFNANMNYQIGKGLIGLGYERIDPDYKSLGGYYFNNDLENITVNASQKLFEDKLSIGINTGLQKDDLNDAKVTKMKRLVMALNTNYKPSDELSISGSYSSFQSFTNIKNQFDYINEVSQIENELNKANISQISQNANLNVNYTLNQSKKKRESLNVGGSFQNAVNSIDDGKTPDELSDFYNGNLIYAIAYLEKKIALSGGLNLSYSKLTDSRGLIFGPTLSIKKSLLKKKLRLTSTLSYNQSRNNGKNEGDVLNIRLGGQYIYKKTHNFRLNFLNQKRTTNLKTKNDLTATLGYNYAFKSFGSKNLKRKKKKNKKLKT